MTEGAIAGVAKLRQLLESFSAKTDDLKAATVETSAKLAEASSAVLQSSQAVAEIRRLRDEAQEELDDAENTKHRCSKDLAETLSRGPAFLQLPPRSNLELSNGVRVAACFMLKPSLLNEVPGVLGTYLYYHLLAPRGPRLTHVFIFIDEPPCPEIEHWLNSFADSTLRARVTLLDGRGPASLTAIASNRPAARDAEVRSAAAQGELIALQMLNAERALVLADDMGIDWLLCNLDIDEALVSSRCVGEILAGAPSEAYQLVFLNHEIVPEVSEPEDYFLSCTLAKRNPSLLTTNAAQEETKRCIDCWMSRLSAAELKLQGNYQKQRTERRASSHFYAYANGKSAVRVAACRANGAFPLGSHSWHVPVTSCTDDIDDGSRTEAALGVAFDPAEACILHYSNCEGLAGFTLKYGARVHEQWSKLPFHRLCQLAQLEGESALRWLFETVVLVTDAKEAERQVDAGVCARIVNVRDACMGGILCLDSMD